MRSLTLIPFFIAAAACADAAEDPVVFSRDIRPLLAKNCTTCHGGVKQAGGISFIFRSDILEAGESGVAVVIPGKPAESELIRRIKSSDPEMRMPPPKEHPDPLDTEQIALLERWILEGAEWEEHWAFSPPQATPAPSVKHVDWPKAELDHWVLARLETEGVQPSPEAELHEWLRRVSLDLTGLPPTLEEWETVQAAAVGDREAAMAAAADRLLESPHFGERWASMWLDLARYSDTYGFENDPHRDIWPFRDWVVRAFNADMPYDQFTIKQLAGDLLADPEPGDLLATAFHRNTQTNIEGGTDDEEFRTAAVLDRVSTTWTAWQGTTFGCVQCHAHPYDPIPHQDFYRFTAFFNNSEDVDLKDDFPQTLVTSDPGQQAEAQRLEKEIRDLRNELNSQALQQVADDADGWLPILPMAAVSSGPQGQLVIGDDGIVSKTGTHPNNVVFTLRFHVSSFGLLRLEIFPEQENPAEWAGLAAVASKVEAELVATDGSRRPVAFREMIADFLAGPFDPNDSLRDGEAGFGEYPMTHGPRTGYFVPQEPVVAREGEVLEVRLQQKATSNSGFLAAHLNRFRLSFADDSRLSSWVAMPERQERWTELEEKKQRLQAIPGLKVPVMLERQDPARRDTRLFLRGNRLTRDESVDPGIPELFGGGEPAERLDRLAMAEWLVGDKNPLTARVMANRLWAELFGIGIVETQEDFGSAGLSPTHQPLLDHLALRLKDHHGWKMKPFLREIVLSATYRQSAKAEPELLARDAKNQLLAKGPRQRLSGEMVRDQALAVSGLLSPKLAGPPVFPPQPDGIWKSVYSGARWETSEGEDRYRRALYTYRKRTSGYPALLAFDAPTGDLCSPRRIATNTPLQALATLNDPAQIEFAQAFAKRMEAAGADAAAQVAHGFRLLTLREAPTEVVEVLTNLHATALAELNDRPEPLAASPHLAALVVVANTLLNMDAVLNR